MSALKSRLEALASSFASDVVRAIQSSSLEELLGEAGGRGLGSRQSRQRAPARTAQPSSRNGRLRRRSPEDIEAALNKVHGLLKASRDGLRAEQIRVALKLDVREMPRVLKEGLASKKLTSKGQKRATTYFAR